MSDEIRATYRREYDDIPRQSFNPAHTANPVLEKYLPALGIPVKAAYAMYSLDSFQLARLIRMVERTARDTNRRQADDDDTDAGGNDSVSQGT